MAIIIIVLLSLSVYIANYLNQKPRHAEMTAATGWTRCAVNTRKLCKEKSMRTTLHDSR